MIRGATLRGRVVDAAGAAVADADVQVRWRGILGEDVGALRETITEEDGSFELEHVAVGKLELIARWGPCP